MAKLYYSTKESNNIEKVNFYFTCHPADFNPHFDRISEDIFQTIDCAIWHRPELDNPEMQKDREVYNVNLTRMQFFVIPVTSQFLHQPNNARVLELRFALENHIPVLPILVEPGLEEEFVRICGDLPFIYKQRSFSELTVISYKNKLQEFIRSMLQEKDLEEESKAAFDVYVYVSYCIKEDFDYARELRHLIYRDKVRRRLAFFFDESMEPSDSFRDIMRKILERKDLFPKGVTSTADALKAFDTTIITPTAHDRAEKNMRTTAAAAAASSAPILTDAQQMQKIREYALAESNNKEDVTHMFFIGLAYLEGIEVEQDVRHAIRLITQAADAGLEEAAHKLVLMYRNGERVEKNKDAEIWWQKKLDNMSDGWWR